MISSQIPKNVYNKMLSFLKNIEVGTFVDVGAFDGLNYSNTYDLLNKGWFGIYIEPNEISCSKIKKNCMGYSYILHNVAASNVNAEGVDFYLNGEFSSLEYANEVVKCQKIEQTLKTKVKTMTLDAILSDVKKYQLLSLDVEKHEIEVLMGYNISQHNPLFAIIETHEKDKRYKNKISRYCDQYFEKNKYKKYFSDRVNTIYTHKSLGCFL